MPFSFTICPRNCTSRIQNSYLENFVYNVSFLSSSKMFLKCCSCSSADREYINMSSMNTLTNLSKYGCNQ
ncbi:hypothetical protein HanPI659440_Chr09g0329971 [Helianthus annuus]|nr:hypothetical protein HanPI659440_Chr09g0329971 [Helianthus annuus]